MYDITFFRNTYALKKKLINRYFNIEDVDHVVSELNNLKSNTPHIFNVETSNICNMRCIMCPRTSAMTRDVENLSDDDFQSIINQIKPHSKDDIKHFLNFIEDEFGINESTRSEDAFYFYVSSQCITLHGYGEPLIDKNIINRVQTCTDNNIPSYFSCVPANINIKKITELMKSGLNVIKFSIDSLDDMEARKVRGKHNNYTKAYKKIEQLLEIKANYNYQTKIVCTMLDLGTDIKSINKQKRFIELWKDKDVFAYVKSLDNRWYNELDEQLQNKSHYDSQYCEFPWMSLTVMSNGNIVPCTQDYDAEMAFGNIKEDSLEDVWNSKKYQEFRKMHISGDFPKGHKCNERCDIKIAYSYISDN